MMNFRALYSIIRVSYHMSASHFPMWVTCMDRVKQTTLGGGVVMVVVRVVEHDLV